MELLTFETSNSNPSTQTQIQALHKDHPEIAKWVMETAELCQPKEIYVCNGSETEKKF